MVNSHIPRIAEFTQAPSPTFFPRIVQHMKIQGLTLSPMNFKEEIGRRIRKSRLERDWILEDLERETGDVLTLKRISAYENGDRMPGPQEAVILAKALGVRPAYLLAVDDIQIPISQQEEALIRNWRTLAERDRMDIYRKVETMALQSRDPAMGDFKIAPPPQERLPKVAVHKKIRKDC